LEYRPLAVQLQFRHKASRQHLHRFESQAHPHLYPFLNQWPWHAPHIGKNQERMPGLERAPKAGPLEPALPSKHIWLFKATEKYDSSVERIDAVYKQSNVGKAFEQLK